jgi:hypothetical protein
MTVRINGPIEPTASLIVRRAPFDLNCVLNLVRSHVESLKLMCIKFFKVKYAEIDGRRVTMPEPKTVDEIRQF